MSGIVIFAYQAKAGKDKELLQLPKDHVPALRRLGLATVRQSVLMHASDDTFVQIFE